MGIQNDRNNQVSYNSPISETGTSKNETTTDPVKALPKEVVFHIFSFTDDNDIPSLKQVSKDWKDVSESHFSSNILAGRNMEVNSLSKVVDFLDKHLTNENHKEVLDKLKNNKAEITNIQQIRIYLDNTRSQLYEILKSLPETTKKELLNEFNTLKEDELSSDLLALKDFLSINQKDYKNNFVNKLKWDHSTSVMELAKNAFRESIEFVLNPYSLKHPEIEENVKSASENIEPHKLLSLLGHASTAMKVQKDRNSIMIDRKIQEEFNNLLTQLGNIKELEEEVNSEPDTSTIKLYTSYLMCNNKLEDLLVKSSEFYNITFDINSYKEIITTLCLIEGPDKVSEMVSRLITDENNKEVALDTIEEFKNPER